MIRNVASCTRQQQSLTHFHTLPGLRQYHQPPQPSGKSPSRFQGLPTKGSWKSGSPKTTRDERPKARVRYTPDAVARVPRAGPGAEVRLLRAPILAERLSKLCDAGKYDDAVAMLRSAPLDAQNTIVWNTLISKVMRAQKFQVGFHLYTDMKRRGHAPTARTYSTMLRWYGEVSDWAQFTKQLDNVHAIYNGYQAYAEEVKETDPHSRELNNYAANMYLKILGRAGLYQKVFDVVNDMDDHGPLAPDAVTYSEVFRALYQRTTISGTKSLEQVYYQNASDAKFLWRRFMKQVERGDVSVDAVVLGCYLRILSWGRPSDQLHAFDLVRDYTGLAKPGETAPRPPFALSSQVLAAVLELCLRSEKPRLCIHFVQQIMDRAVPDGERPILDVGHMRQVIGAYAKLAGLGSINESRQALETLEWMLRQGVLNPSYESRIRPDLPTYRAAFHCFWQGKDWVSATRAFELMTGYAGKAFRDGASGSVKPQQRSPGKSLAPDSFILSLMARIVNDSRDRANMRQCLRILDTVHTVDLLKSVRQPKDHVNPTANHPSGRKANKASIQEKRAVFYDIKLAEAVIELVDNVLAKVSSSRAAEAPIDDENDHGDADASYLAPGYSVTSDERKRWLALKAEAKMVVDLNIQTSYKPTNNQVLGDEKYVSAMEKAVDLTIASRYATSAGSRRN